MAYNFGMNATAIKTTKVINGSRQVIITEDYGVVSARLYVNHGETACHQNWNGKTMAGAIRWANKTLGL